MTASDENEVDAELFNEELSSETHQLNKIFDMIGTPSTTDIDAIQSAVLKKILGDWTASYPVEGKGFASKYTAATPDAIALLESMLLFNPSSRSTLEATLSSEYLKDSNTAPLVPMDPAEALKSHGVHMTFPFERDPNLTQDKLRTLLVEECDRYAAGERGPVA
jgi:hypothetical protein